MASYSQKSPYYTTSQSNGYLDVMKPRDIPSFAEDRQWEITSLYKHRPDLLAYDLYKDAALWWVFAARNKDIIRDPIYDMIPGVKIFVPQPQTLKKVLGN